MSVFDIEGVCKAYPNLKGNEMKVTLRDITLKIEENELVCLIGPSGCGKTTLLNLMAGFEMPTCGTIRYRDKGIEGPSPERGVVFQEYSLLPWMDVVSNVEFAIEDRVKDKARRREVAMEYLDMVGLAGFADHRPNLLSGGMKQRVAIARTIAMEPDVLLMDEPFSALDEQTRRKLDGELLEIWEKNKRTVVFVTHNVDEAILIATRIVMISSAPGKVMKEWNITAQDKEDPVRKAKLKEDIVKTLHLCPCAVRSSSNIIQIGQSEGRA